MSHIVHRPAAVGSERRVPLYKKRLSDLIAIPLGTIEHN